MKNKTPIRIEIYYAIISFIVRYYSGAITWKIGKYYMSGVKPYLGLFMVTWGVLKLTQFYHNDMVYWAWWDYLMLALLIPQLLGGFSMFAIKEQKRLKLKYNK
jgi:hypothetical protein